HPPRHDRDRAAARTAYRRHAAGGAAPAARGGHRPRREGRAVSMSRRQGVGLVAGVAVAAAFVAGTASAGGAPWQTVAREPLAVPAGPEAEVAVVSCAGRVLALGRDAADASGLAAAAAPELTVSPAAGRAEATENRLAA